MKKERVKMEGEVELHPGFMVPCLDQRSLFTRERWD